LVKILTESIEDPAGMLLCPSVCMTQPSPRLTINASTSRLWGQRCPRRLACRGNPRH
jgi:hypothetical protein